MQISDFKKYMEGSFSADVVSILRCDNKEYYKYLNDGNGFYEGTIRAGIWSVLRSRLPNDWFVQAECEYPSVNNDSKDRADIVVWSPEQKSFVIEVKPFVGIGVIKKDITKLKNYLDSYPEKEKPAYLVYTTIYGYPKNKNMSVEDLKSCRHCLDKYEIGGCMPWGYGYCPDCEFTKKTLEYLKEDNITLIPLYFKVKPEIAEI